jgi:hypothetical protein
MSYFVVPAVSYQTQQKLKKMETERKKKKSRGEGSDSNSIYSNSSGKSRLKGDSNGETVGDSVSRRQNSDIEEDRDKIFLAFPTKLKSSSSSEGLAPLGPRKYFARSNSSASSLADVPDKARNASTYSSSSNASQTYHSESHKQNILTPHSGTSPATSPGYVPTNSQSSSPSGFPFPQDRRNSSLTSNHSHSKPLTRFSRRLSSPYAGTEDDKVPARIPRPKGTETEKSIFKPSYNTEIPQRKVHIPTFKPIIDITVLNSSESIKQALLMPSFQVFRYNNFLDILRDYHSSDPVNFASVRHQSMRKFIVRNRLKSHWESKLQPAMASTTDPSTISLPHKDIRFYEGILAHELLRLRCFLRKLIRAESSKRNFGILHNEEFLQLNFSNYVRFLIGLPDIEDKSILTELELEHYSYKDLFNKIGDELCLIKNTEDGEVDTDMDEHKKVLIKNNLLLQAITKVSYEYILFEKYHIQILSKLHNNSLIGSEVLENLFNKHKHHIKTNNLELPKILLFNTYYSAQYAWLLCTMIPFVRVFESSIYQENNKLMNDAELYLEIEARTIKTSFAKSDQELFDTFSSKLYINDFEQYQSLTPDHLVKIHKLLDNQSPKYKKVNRHETPDPCSTYSHKPMNFEHYGSSLSTIGSNTFDLVQSRDLALQVSPSNYNTVLREFHRILKPGGYLELPTLQVGSEFIQEHIENVLFKPGSDFQHPAMPKASGASRVEDLDMHMVSEVIPNFPQVLLAELNTIFGNGTVKYSISILDSQNEINGFLFKHIRFLYLEMRGKFDEYCAKLDETDENNALSTTDDESIHYFIQIRARKSM